MVKLFEKKPLEDPKTGIHRAKPWEIACLSLNDISITLYALLFSYVSYFLTGWVGVTAMVAGTIATALRMWDGVTDPIVGMIVDNTNGKFGKNRPYILLGNLIMVGMSGLIFWAIPGLPQGARFIAYILMYMCYIIGYTAQSCITKSAQSCLTNDPEQRPVFTMFNTVFSAIMMVFYPLMLTDYLMPKYGTVEMRYGDAMSNIGFYREMWLILASFSALFAVCAIIGLWRKDRVQYYGTGKVQKFKFKDYWDVMKNNRAIQMLVVATATDKIATSMSSNGTIMICLYGIIVGNYANYSRMSALSTVPNIVLSLLLIQFIARKMGQKKAMLVGTYGGIVSCAAILCLFLFGDYHTLDLTFANGLTAFTAIFFALWLCKSAFQSLTNGLGITMTADCAEYEVYRSGRYVPGLMGTLFTFVNKMISSVSTTLVAVLFTAIGFKNALPTQADTFTPAIFAVTMFCLLGAPIIGFLFNVVAMKFYPLNKEKMAEIQETIAEIKQREMAAAAEEK